MLLLHIRLFLSLSFIVLKALRWLVLYEWELRGFGVEAQPAIELVPLGAKLSLPILLLLLLLLGCHSQLLELLTVHFHVGADDLVGYRRDSLVPVLLLGAV